MVSQSGGEIEYLTKYFPHHAPVLPPTLAFDVAVLVISELPGVTSDVAEQWAPMMARLRRQPGLVIHADGPTERGWRVISIWDSREDFERFFDSAIKPNLPPGAPARDVVSDLRAVLLPDRQATES